MNDINICQNERGAALVVALMFVAILGMLGTTAVILTTTDIQIGGNYRTSQQAFYVADAGVNYGIGKMEAALEANPDTYLPKEMLIGNYVDLSGSAYAAPSGFNFTYQPLRLTKIGDNAYSFTTVGLDPNNTGATATITATIKRKSAIEFGVFGDQKVDLGNTAAIYSYSHTSSSPTPANSTGEGDVGSNQSIILRRNSIVDGDVALGESAAGTDGTLTNLSGVPVTPEDIDRVDPDPLGVIGGDYAAKFVSYSTCSTLTSLPPPTNTNENCCKYGNSPLPSHCFLIDPNDTSSPNPLVYDPTGAISGNNITLGNGATLTLRGKPGGANYYFNDIRLSHNSVIYIETAPDATTDPPTHRPVYIFLTGEIDAVTGSNFVNTTAPVPNPTTDPNGCTCSASSCPPGAPSDFTIYANSNSDTDRISIGNSVTYSGVIYAPYITVRLDNSADIYGAIVGKEVEIVNSVHIYFDTDLKDDYLTTDLLLTSWRDVRN